MSQVTLVFDRDGSEVHVHCDRVQQPASDARVGDYIACPYTGFVHVHEVRVAGNTAFITDCHSFEHIYRVSTVLEIARPTKDAAGGC